MPVEQHRVGMRLAGIGQPDLAAAEGIVIAPVLELLADASADLQPVLRRNGDVTAIEERVQVGAKQQAVRDLVRAAVGVRTDVRRLEDGLASTYRWYIQQLNLQMASKP